jgi:hypothetical protein
MYKFKEHNIPNRLNEMTVKEWETINMILASTEQLIEKYFQIFGLFGVKEDEFNDMNTDDFAQLIVQYNEIQTEKIEPVTEITIDGFTYQSFELEKGIPIRDLKHIEKAFSTGMTDRIAFMLAVIFKRTDLSSVEHYAEAHIKQKTKLFSRQLASIAIPFVDIINKELKIVFDNVSKQNENESESTVPDTSQDSKELE